MGRKELRELALLAGLQSINLHHSHVTDAELKDLASLEQLEVLDLSDNHVTNAGLKDLAALKRMRVLNLSQSDVTGAGLKWLVRLRDLESLDLAHIKSTGQGFEDLACFEAVEGAVAPRRGIEVATGHPTVGMAEVTFKSFRLANANVTDSDLKQLASLSDLRILDWNGTNIGDDGVRELARLKELWPANTFAGQRR